MIALDELLGSGPARAMLLSALAGGRLPHALLFQGPEGVGKGTAAQATAAALLCESPTPRGACGGCPTCRRVASWTDPDLHLVTRLARKRGGAAVAAGEDEDEEDGEEGAGTASGAELKTRIVVDQIRTLIAHAAFAPRGGRHRVFVVDPADRMNAEAQNALLKTLEEPPGRSIVILVASRPHLLLPTVRSRCLPVRFTPLPVPELAAGLRARGMGEDEALARAALASGAPGRALTLDLEDLRARREEVLGTLEALAASPSALGRLPQWTAALGGKEEDALLLGLDLAEGLLRDAVRLTTGGDDEALGHADLKPRLAALGRALGPSRAAELVRAAERLRADLRFNVNRTLLAEAFLCASAGGPLP